MRRTHALVVVPALAAYICACASNIGGSERQAPAEGNLVVNPGYEQVDGGSPRGWTFESRAAQKGKASAVRANPHSGDYSLKLEPNAKNKPWDIANNPLSMGQAFPAGPYRGRTLHVSGWLGAEGPAVAVAGLFALRSDGGVVFARLEQDSSKPGLVYHQDSLLVPDDPKIQYIILNCAVEGTEGAAFFDDLAVSLTAPAQPLARPSAAGGMPQSAEIIVDAGNTGRPIPRTVYGSNIEWIWNGNGIWNADKQALDPDLVTLTREAGISLLRFPGGVFADFYHWRDGIGPRSSRRETEHSRGGPRSVHVFGTDEALAFAAETGSELLITVNAGTGTAQEAADWVKYVNQTPGKSPRVQYWEIGNELYIKDPKFVSITPAAYRERLVEFTRAMRRVDPSIKIAAISDENYPRSVQSAYRDWTPEVLRAAAAHGVDYLAVHNAYAPMLVADKGDDVRTVYTAMLAAPVLIKQNLDAVSQKIDALGPETAGRLKIAVTEWGPFFHFDVKNRFVDHVKTLGSALYVASVLKVLVESPKVEIANAFKLVDPLFMGWIGLRDGRPAATAPYLAFQLFTRHFGERLVPSVTKSPTFDSRAVGWVDRVPDVPYLDVVASRSADGNTLYVLAVNKHLDQPLVARITLRGFTPAGTATAWVLNGAGIDAHTGTRPLEGPGIEWGKQAADEPNGRFGRGGPGEVSLTSRQVPGVSSTFEYSFPAHSVTSLEIRGR